MAQRVVRRHEILAKFLEEVLGVAAETAEANACRLEHAMVPEVVNRLIGFVEFIEKCPRAGDELRDGFRPFYQSRQAAKGSRRSRRRHSKRSDAKLSA